MDWREYFISIRSDSRARRSHRSQDGGFSRCNAMPYEIVGENQMRHIKFRFSALVIENLLRIVFSLLSQDIIQEHEAMFV